MLPDNPMINSPLWSCGFWLYPLGLFWRNFRRPHLTGCILHPSAQKCRYHPLDWMNKMSENPCRAPSGCDRLRKGGENEAFWEIARKNETSQKKPGEKPGCWHLFHTVLTSKGKEVTYLGGDFEAPHLRLVDFYLSSQRNRSFLSVNSNFATRRNYS